MPLWSELTHKQFIDAANNTEVAVMVTGALEIHGNHLPLGTDTILPMFLAEKVAKRTNALVLPPIVFGDSWTFATFEGTLSLQPETLIAVYTEIIRGVFKHGFRYLVVINGHGGNVCALKAAAAKATENGEKAVVIVNWWLDLAKETRKTVLETQEGHAAEDETSELMYVRPELADMKNAIATDVKRSFTVIAAAYRNELYPFGVFGNPHSATVEKGEQIMKQAEEELVELILNLEKGVLPINVKHED